MGLREEVDLIEEIMKLEDVKVESMKNKTKRKNNNKNKTSLIFNKQSLFENSFIH